MQPKDGIVVLEKADEHDADIKISMSNCALLGGLQPPQAEKLESCFVSNAHEFFIDKSKIAKLKIEGDKIRREREQKDKECPKLLIDWQNCGKRANDR